ncbi:hypothetical protein, partial [Microcoleus anatoxicus]|uniref:hypothetical protein n=1 Tax=Microcoleus anatoxicus TaxID=2705319 RepID=UPI0030C9AD28
MYTSWSICVGASTETFLLTVISLTDGNPHTIPLRLVWDERRVRRGFHLFTISKLRFEQWAGG